MRPKDSEVTVWMSARTDAIDIRTQCEPSALEDLFARVWQNAPALQHEPEPEIPEQPDEADEDARTSRRALLEKVVQYHRRLGEDVDIAHPGRETTNDLLFNPQTLEEALSEMGLRHLGVTFYVMCPRTSKPVQQNKRTIEYERWSEIPEEISCENEPEIRLHSTKNNTWLKVGPHSDVPAFSYTVIAMWSAAFVVFLALDTLFFVWLRDVYPKQQLFILASWILVNLAPVGAIYLIYGPSAFKAAGEFLRELGSLVLRRLPSSKGKQVVEGSDYTSSNEDDPKEGN
jgi:hypothetical protein